MVTMGKGLTIFDIDETLFKTKALIHIIHDGFIVRKLNNKEFNDYELGPGESFDFCEFRSAEVFNATSEPINKIIAKVRAILYNAEKAGSKVIFLTARADFDNKELFLETFRDQGIDIDKIYIERAGNLGDGRPAINKEIIIRQYLDTNDYSRTRFYDDSTVNVEMFMSLQKSYPDISFEGFVVNSDGSTTTVKNKD
jgi:hypothetical protein